jgi:hypothetical protein
VQTATAMGYETKKSVKLKVAESLWRIGSFQIWHYILFALECSFLFIIEHILLLLSISRKCSTFFEVCTSKCVKLHKHTSPKVFSIACYNTAWWRSVPSLWWYIGSIVSVGNFTNWLNLFSVCNTKTETWPSDIVLINKHHLKNNASNRQALSLYVCPLTLVVSALTPI